MEPVLKAPLNVEWEITKACNLRCKHCYTSAGLKEPGELTTSEAMQVIAHLDHIGVSDITISGGEPLLRNDLEVILNEMRRREIPFVLYTNGILLSKERIQSLKDAGVTTLSLSLNGTTRETHDFVSGEGTFDAVIKKIGELQASGIRVQALYTLMKVNVREALALPSLLDDIKLESLCLYPFYPAGRGMHHLSHFEVGGEELNRVVSQLTMDRRIYLGGCVKGVLKGLVKGSPCARLMCLITSEGKVRPCNFLPFQTEESLLQKDVYTLWKSPLFEKVRTWQAFVERTCVCEYVEVCQGNCLAFHLPLLSEEEMRTFEGLG